MRAASATSSISKPVFQLFLKMSLLSFQKSLAELADASEYRLFIADESLTYQKTRRIAIQMWRSFARNSKSWTFFWTQGKKHVS